ncbi:MAG: hypothetical protein ACRDZ4_17690, partial [Egibacteraceae bacterium]
VRAGGPLRLPDRHAHDPGDYGLAVYLTSVPERARTYALRAETGHTLVQVDIELTNALFLDWRKGSALDPKHPGNEVLDFFTARWGNPVRGTPEERRVVAIRWRENLLARGYDGFVVERQGEVELAVYLPEVAIKKLTLKPEGAP